MILNYDLVLIVKRQADSNMSVVDYIVGYHGQKARNKMGQAKIRKQEISELKAKGPKPKPFRMPTTIKAFGAYYHDDQLDGIGVYLSEDFEPAKGWTNITFHTLKDLVVLEATKYFQMDEANQAKYREFAWDSLHDAIRDYNQEVFGSDTRVVDSETKTTVLTDSLIETFVSVITNIWILELLKEIPNDDYNGTILEFKN